MTFRYLSLNLLTLLLLSGYAFAGKTKEKSCDGVEVNKTIHKKDIIAKGIDRPYQLSVFEDSFYFSYNFGNDTQDTFKIGHLKKKDDMESFDTIKNGFATAIDRENKIAYFGGSEGIYEADLNKNREIKPVFEGHKYNIWDMFFDQHLYFILYPSLLLYKKVGNTTERVEHIDKEIYHFVIDDDNDTFIATKDGIYEIKNGTTESIHYDGPKLFRALEIDREGNAYFCGQNGIYVADKHNHTLVEIASIKDIFGLTFDEDNHIIYSDPHEIVRLLPENC
ncbi:hypothetical protein K1T71_003376 [Dendrolimus kikuchii]|uniref:Uncharacterized protein n=1 Tax=Dendrolimus kikuchii TaxID=765133 RepID=A0ACC1DCB1_9NEOP|nr:hypothetical protein K1T71_003376 [Dendrolimus kikuchii]